MAVEERLSCKPSLTTTSSWSTSIQHPSWPVNHMKRAITFTIATSSVTVLFSQWYFVSFPRPRAQSNCNETVGFCRLWQVGCVSLFSQFGFNRTRIFHCYDLHIQIAGGTLETRLNDKQATLGQVTKQPDKFEARKRYKTLAIARKNKCSMRVYSCY